MNLKIEYQDQQFVEADLDQIIYFVGPNHDMLWKIFRSFYFYRQKLDVSEANIYGENGIELLIDDHLIDLKHNHFYFINSRQAIYQQIVYHKPSLLFDYLNQKENEVAVTQHLEHINNELYQLSFLLQDYVDDFADSLQVDLKDLSYLELLKNNLVVGYQENQVMTPIELMSTDELVDEYLNLIATVAQRTADKTWLIMYNPASYLSTGKIGELVSKLKQVMLQTNLKVIYIANDFRGIRLDSADIHKTILVGPHIEQLPPFDVVVKSLKNHYPNMLDLSDQQILKSLTQLLPLIGSKREVALSSKDLVLLKIINDLLDYETSFNLEDYLLTDAEISFLKNQ